MSEQERKQVFAEHLIEKLREAFDRDIDAVMMIFFDKEGVNIHSNIPVEDHETVLTNTARAISQNEELDVRHTALGDPNSLN